MNRDFEYLRDESPYKADAKGCLYCWDTGRTFEYLREDKRVELSCPKCGRTANNAQQINEVAEILQRE